jgi:signal transduction histidine kinase
MRIQTRLFLGTALLVLALMAGQWWLHVRQLGAIERELGTVAAMVGKDLLSHHVAMIAAPGEAIGAQGFTRVWVTAEGDDGDIAPTEVIGEDGELIHDVHVVTVPEGASTGIERRVERIVRIDEDGTTEETIEHLMTLDLEALAAADVGHMEVQTDVSTATDSDEVSALDHGEARTAREVELRVVSRQSSTERFLVVRDGAGERRIQIPVSPTQKIVRSTLEKSLLMSGGLLLLGLAGSGVLASRMTRPLRQLAETSEAVGSGELGVQVEESAAGEVGELQRSFNRMSTRLAELESERESWRRREHLAQLGDLSRGLAHTVRNPLNTLGLAVEELARDDAGQTHLVATARQQIRRIDRWLRSFLALGASDAAVVERTDLGALAEEVVLESIQEGATVRFEKAEEPIHVSCVPSAMRAALANLLENAADASPNDATVDVALRLDENDAVLTVADRGPGLPDAVRQRLYSPHVTTKVEGSGMGLFLARQLVVGMHDGRLSVTDRDGGGTEAEVRIPMAEDDE